MCSPSASTSAAAAAAAAAAADVDDGRRAGVRGLGFGEGRRATRGDAAARRGVEPANAFLGVVSLEPAGDPSARRRPPMNRGLSRESRRIGWKPFFFFSSEFGACDGLLGFSGRIDASIMYSSGRSRFLSASAAALRAAASVRGLPTAVRLPFSPSAGGMKSSSPSLLMERLRRRDRNTRLHSSISPGCLHAPAFRRSIANDAFTHRYPRALFRA